jgi:hypothetical protein
MQLSIVSPLTILLVFRGARVGINSDSDRAASLVIGPTSLGMVRIYVESDGIELPMDFEPDEALDIANELCAAAELAMATAAKGAPKHRDPDRAGGRPNSRPGPEVEPGPKQGGRGRRG